jgi:hypothetical protein
MKMLKLVGLPALALLVSSGPLFAHHGTAASYDHKKAVAITGVVKEFRWRNPHSSVFLAGKDASGKEVIYAIEMSAPASAVRRGFTRSTMKPGDQVVMQMHPSFTNPVNGVNVTGATIVINGKEFKPAGQEE